MTFQNIFEEMLAKVNKTLKEDHSSTGDDTLNFTHIRVRSKRLSSHDSVCTPTPDAEHKRLESWDIYIHML